MRLRLLLYIFITFTGSVLLHGQFSFQVKSGSSLACDTLICVLEPVNIPSNSASDTTYLWRFIGRQTNSTSILREPSIILTKSDTVDVELKITLGSIESISRKENFLVVIPKPDTKTWEDQSYKGTTEYEKSFNNSFQAFENVKVQSNLTTISYSRDWYFFADTTNITRNTDLSTIPGIDHIANQQNVVYTFPDSINYYFIKLIVASDNIPSCKSSGRITPIKISTGIILQNIMLPDNENPELRSFKYFYDGTTPINFKIFNRFGSLVYQSNAPSVVWDGNSFSGSPSPSGVYYYVLSTGDGVISTKGFFHLFRK